VPWFDFLLLLVSISSLAFQKPVAPTLMPAFSSPAPMQGHMPMPLSPSGPYMNTFPAQVAPLTPIQLPMNLNSNFATPMPVCPKCHHSYAAERMAVHVKVCGGTLDRADGLRSPTPNMGRSLSGNNLEQLSQEDDSSNGRGYNQFAKGAYAAKDEQIGGPRRRSVHEPSDSSNALAYAAKDDKPVGGGSGRGTGAYTAKDDQPIGGARGGGAYAGRDDGSTGGRYAAKDDQPVGGAPRTGTGAYAAKDEQPIGSARRRSVKEEQPLVFDESNRGGGAYLAKDEKPVGARAGTGAYAAKDDQPIGGRAGTGAYAAKDDQPIGGRTGTGSYAAKDDQPIGGRAGTGAYAAKDDQPIGGARRRSVKEDQPLSFPEPVAASPARRRSVKEEQPPLEENRGAGAYLAKDEKPVGGGGRPMANSFSEPAAAPIRRRSVKEEQSPFAAELPVANLRRRSVKEELPPFAARDDAGEEGGSRRGSLVSEVGVEDDDGEDDDGRRPKAGTGNYLAKDDKPVGHSAEGLPN